MKFLKLNTIQNVGTYCRPVVVKYNTIVLVNSNHQLLILDNGTVNIISENKFGGLFLVGSEVFCVDQSLTKTMILTPTNSMNRYLDFITSPLRNNTQEGKRILCRARDETNNWYTYYDVVKS